MLPNLSAGLSGSTDDTKMPLSPGIKGFCDESWSNPPAIFSPKGSSFSLFTSKHKQGCSEQGWENNSIYYFIYFSIKLASSLKFPSSEGHFLIIFGQTTDLAPPEELTLFLLFKKIF